MYLLFFFYRNLQLKEKLVLNELEKQRIKSMSELEQTEEECLIISNNLDEANKKLYDQLVIHNEKLLEYESVSMEM